MRKQVCGNSNYHRKTLTCNTVPCSKYFSQESSRIWPHEMFVNVREHHYSVVYFLFQRIWPGLTALHISTLTHYMFPGGKRQGYLEKAGSRGRDKGDMKLNPAGQDAAWACAQKLACLGVYKTNRSETCKWWGQGWQSLGQCLGDIGVVYKI